MSLDYKVDYKVACEYSTLSKSSTAAQLFFVDVIVYSKLTHI